VSDAVDLLQSDPAAAAVAAAAELARITGVENHDVAVVLGSGWLPAADVVGTTVTDIPVTDLPYFAPPVVEGHAGRLRSTQIGDTRTLVFLGRTHLYEGRGVEAVAHAVRTAAAAGCRVVVLTNGCGGLNPSWSPGTPVLISDHINFTNASPLRGGAFLDLTDLYSTRLRELCRQVQPGMPEGVYAQFRGPQYETPAEIRMARVLGVDLVGMSTTLEAIAAREAGMEVLGISLVTNFAAGMTGAPLDHQDVLDTGHAAAHHMGVLLREVISNL